MAAHSTKVDAALRFARQAHHLSADASKDGDVGLEPTTAIKAHFVTPRDPVIETASGDRLPAVPLEEAEKLNQLKDEVLGHDRPEHLKPDTSKGPQEETQADIERENEEEALRIQDAKKNDRAGQDQNEASATFVTGAIRKPEAEADSFGRISATLKDSMPPSRTNPMFPPLPLYGPPSFFRDLQCILLRVTSFWLSLGFLGAVIVGSAVTSVPLMFRHIWLRLTCRTPDARRPFYEEEKRRDAIRKREDSDWKHRKRRRASSAGASEKDAEGQVGASTEEFVPTEGGKDRLVCDPAYYARRVGLDLEEFDVQTEDGFIITLWHVYNPREYAGASAADLAARKPEVLLPESSAEDPASSRCAGRRKPGAPTRYPVLLVHGLLQSSGAFCANDDRSLAFFLAKSGYDVWLGNNRCGFRPRHTLLSPSDPRMWAFNIRQMGVLDLPALVSRVLGETGFARLALVCHSQGTTQALVALAKDQRPELGARISVFCALAPAAYAGPLIDRTYFKFMNVLSSALFRVVFGIHAFIPAMMFAHRTVPGRLYGAIGYRVFAFLFGWTDDRWERALRDRMFIFAPVYVSAESMRWWLGRDCFARHRCILATREEGWAEDREDRALDEAGPGGEDDDDDDDDDGAEGRGDRAWYDGQAPKMAFWVAGADRLVDGERLLRRFERGREPHVEVVHARVVAGYEHLDVLWAVDALAQVGCEVRDVIWDAAEVSSAVAVPKGLGTKLDFSGGERR